VHHDLERRRPRAARAGVIGPAAGAAWLRSAPPGLLGSCRHGYARPT
jgi:hypothetical protein